MDQNLYEAECSRDPTNITAWFLWLESKYAQNPKDRFHIYDNAVAANPRSYKLWKRYLIERMDYALTGHSKEEYSFTNQRFNKALGYLVTLPRVWELYFDHLIPQKWIITKTRQLFDRCLQSLPSPQHHRIWSKYAEFVLQDFIPPVTRASVLSRRVQIHPKESWHYIEALCSARQWDLAALKLSELLSERVTEAAGMPNRHKAWYQLCQIVSDYPREVTSVDGEAVLLAAVRQFTDQVGKLWVALAQRYVNQGQRSKARDVFEEALNTVATPEDFGIVFDSYVIFYEAQAEVLATAEENSINLVELEMVLARLENLMTRRDELLSSVKLRQNPHNVIEWLARVNLYPNNPTRITETFTEALLTVNPARSVGSVVVLWVKLAEYYQIHGELKNAREVFKRGSRSVFRNSDDLASLWCHWIEMELLNENYNQALETARRALHKPPLSAIQKFAAERLSLQGSSNIEPEDVHDSQLAGYWQRSLCKSVKLWSLCFDLETCYGTHDTLKSCFERMADLKVVTVKILLCYAKILEERKWFEESFRVFERGVAIFKFPHVYKIWTVYLAKFVARFQSRQLERSRELFEQALAECPGHLAKRIYLMYGMMEEEFGVTRNSLTAYARGAKAVESTEEKYELYMLLIAKTADFLGITKTRPLFQEAISMLNDSGSTELAVRASMIYAKVERGLGEIIRARAIYKHASQFCDPADDKEGLWAAWKDFEVAHGSEETFKDWLLTRRLVAKALDPTTKV